MARLTVAQRTERDEATERLRDWLPPGSIVLCVLRHVSRSGMTRHIDLYATLDGSQEPTYLSGYAARVMGERRTKDGALVVGGCGMDMGFHIVYTLSRYLYPDGFPCVGEGNGYSTRCPSNDHSNPGPDRDNYAIGRMHTGDGGYAIRHRWL